MYRDELAAKTAENDALRRKIVELEDEASPLINALRCKIAELEKKRKPLNVLKRIVFFKVMSRNTSYLLMILFLFVGFNITGFLISICGTEVDEQISNVCSNVICGKDNDSLSIEEKSGLYSCYCFDKNNQPKIVRP